MWLLRALPRLSGWIVHGMHRITAVEGALPPTGPVLVVSNHASGLIDPLVVTVAARRPVRWLAKATLVFHPWLGWLFRAAGCIPVFRRQDDPTQVDRNADAFLAGVEALAGDSVVAMFPEGISHHSPALAPMKTGAARLALAAASQLEAPPPIVPIGVIYRDAPTFRSAAGVVVGQPILWDDLAGRDPQDRQAAQELTERIGAGLEAVTRGLVSWADQAVVEHAAAVLAAQSPRVEPPPSWVARASGMLARMEAEHDLELPALRRRVRAHARALARLGVTPAELAGDGALRTPPWWQGWRAPFTALVWLVGVVWCWPPYRATGILAAKLAPDTDIIATVKAATGIVLFALWIAASALVVGVALGWPWGVLMVPAGVTLALVTLRLEEARQAASAAYKVRTWQARRVQKLEMLREEQRALADQLGRVVARLGPRVEA
jgi:glycerol-3-phosphate O-acyltransferase / dihydroxyacetone phosphate acyltransferase